MQTRQDIRAARLLEMNPDMLVGSAARANALASGGEEEGAQQLAAAPTRIERPGAPAKARTLSLSGLPRSEEHTSELQSLMRNSYAVFCLTKKHRTEKLMTQIKILR